MSWVHLVVFPHDAAHARRPPESREDARGSDSISVAEAEGRLSELIDRVEAGEDIDITRDGKAVARLSAFVRGPKVLKPVDVDALTSIVVSALTQEPTTSRVQKWLGSVGAISSWSVNGPLRNCRLRSQSKYAPAPMTVDEREAALLGFAKLRIESLSVAPVRVRHFRAAAYFNRRHQLVLRSGDALHLAVADDYSATVCCLDKRLAEAGPHLGIETLLLS